MKNKDVITTASEKIKVRKTRSRWHKAMSAIACVVVFCTVYSLILPAITLEASAENPYEGYTLYCTVDEHSHTDECVEENLICDLTEDPAHTHGDECYSPLLICDKPLQARHTHSDDCYETQQQLVCALAETEAHTHTAECMGTEKQLSCTLQEQEAHRHTDRCKGTEKQLTCGLEESDGHTHTADCKTVESQLTCTQTVEAPEHVHTEGFDACYYWYDNNELICEEDHEHSSDCFIQYKAVNCTLHVHSEADGCYTAVETITCGIQESAGHAHSDSCYSNVETYICGKTETDGHTHADDCYTDAEITICGKEETAGHTHSAENNCYADVQVAVCGLTETDTDHLEHLATCYDYTQTELTCTLDTSEPTVHQHTEECYEEILVCEIEEHTHEKNCTIDPESENWVWLTGDKAREVLIAKTNMYVDLTPTAEEFESKLAEFEAADDWDGYEAYCLEVYNDVLAAYTLYLELAEEECIKITDFYKIEDLFYLIDVRPYITSTAYTVNMFNTAWADASHNNALIVIGSNKGSTVGNAIGSNAATKYWSCVVVDSSGLVTNVLTSGSSKIDVAIPTGGYVLLKHNLNLDAEVGDRVVLSGDLANYDLSAATVRNYSSTGYGTIAFSDSIPAVKKYKDNSNNDYPGFNESTQSYDLTPIINNLSTKGKIKINLYDYTDNINATYRSNKLYPGFQQGLGVRSAIGTEIDSGEMNFGDNIVSNMGMGRQLITGTANSPEDSINQTATQFYNIMTESYNETKYGTVNVPLQGEMEMLLGDDGFPVMDGDKSLAYLFTHNESKGVIWVNDSDKDADTDESIDGLFKIYQGTSASDPYNGNYFFDSRVNFAEYDSTTNKINLYNEYITPNWMMYPFGNFLPFSNINTETTRVYDLDVNDMYRQSSWAAYKATQSTYSQYADDYNNLASRLYEFANVSKTQMDSNWAGLDATDEYFNLAGLTDKEGTDTPERIALEQNMYNIDFDEEANFFFGMTIEMDFMQPKDGYYRDEGEIDYNRDAMKFNFTGDDDVWIYVDGVLFLDLTGIHRHVGGEINFQNGTVTYKALNVESGDTDIDVQTYTFRQILEKAGKTEAEINDVLNDAGTFKDYTNHDFKMFYMERGSGSSVCRINFNMPVIRDNAVGVMKQVEVIDADGNSVYNPSYLGDQEYKFRLLRVDSNGNKTSNPFVPAGTPYDIYNLESVKVGSGTVGAGGIITLKANQLAEVQAPENGGKYYIRELMPEDIIVNTGNPDDYSTLVYIDVLGQLQLADTVSGFPMLEGFVGFDSPILDISSGNAIFTYLNKYKIDKIGHLAITKTVDTPSDYLKNLDPTYDFEVTIDGKALPAGTTYTVNNLREGDEANPEVYIDNQGRSIISLKYGQTATIDTGILPGSIFTVRELNTAGYTVTYPTAYHATDSTGDYATGTILPVGSDEDSGQETVNVVIENKERGDQDIDFNLPVTKLLNSFDGNKHSFEFKLEQVNADGTPVATAYKLIDVLVIDVEADADGDGVGEGTGEFELTLSYKDMVDAGYIFPADIWLKITETAGTEAGVAYDDSYYMVKVRIDYSLTDNKMSADILSVEHYVNGTATETEETSPGISFTNDMLDQMTVSKSVVGGSAETEFTFTLAVTNGDRAYTGDLEWSKTPVKADEAASGTLSAESGLYTFKLRHGQTITIKNLPVGAGYTITETNGDGYHPAYRINAADNTVAYTAGSVASGNLTWIVDNQQVTDHVEFENRAGTQLPHTGGAGTTLFTSGGVLIMGASLIMGYAIKKRKNSNN